MERNDNEVSFDNISSNLSKRKFVIVPDSIFA